MSLCVSQWSLNSECWHRITSTSALKSGWLLLETLQAPNTHFRIGIPSVPFPASAVVIPTENENLGFCCYREIGAWIQHRGGFTFWYHWKKYGLVHWSKLWFSHGLSRYMWRITQEKSCFFWASLPSSSTQVGITRVRITCLLLHSEDGDKIQKKPMFST